jgi:hypothetical protein
VCVCVCVCVLYLCTKTRALKRIGMDDYQMNDLGEGTLYS